MPTGFLAVSIIERPRFAVDGRASWVSATSRLVIALAAIAICARAGGAGASCHAKVPAFVQTTGMKLDAGVQTFEAFRLHPDGLVEWARWNSGGALLGLGMFQERAARSYETALASASFSERSPDVRNDGPLGRPAASVELTAVSTSAVRTRLIDGMPEDLQTLTDRLRRRVKRVTPRAGSYVWTRPHQTAAAADVDLVGQCDDGMARLLEEAARSGRLIVGPHAAARAFASGERASRMEFIAKIAIGELRFGVLSVK
jgi:hypothetical protein